MSATVLPLDEDNEPTSDDLLMTQQEEEEEEEEESSSKMGAETPSLPQKIKKVDMIREAFAKGIRTPKAVIDYVRDRYREEVSSAQVSGLKAKEGLRTAGSGSQDPASSLRERTTPSLHSGSGGGVSLGDLEALKEMATCLGGWEPLRKMIDFLSAC